MQEQPESSRKTYLIQSDDAEPRIKLTPGKRYEVVVTSIVDSDLREITGEAKRPAARPPRLCGSRSTCVALVEID